MTVSAYNDNTTIKHIKSNVYHASSFSFSIVPPNQVYDLKNNVDSNKRLRGMITNLLKIAAHD